MEPLTPSSQLARSSPALRTIAATQPRIVELRRFLTGLARQLGRGQLDPDDLAQDVLERWLRSALQRPIANPEAWTRVIMRRLVIDRFRQRASCPVVLADHADRVAVASQSEPWWRDVDLEIIEDELARLPLALGETLRKFVFEARSYKQISRELHIAMGTVAVRISRARAQLSRRLRERCAKVPGDVRRWPR